MIESKKSKKDKTWQVKELFQRFVAKEISHHDALKEYSTMDDSLFASSTLLTGENILKMVYLVQSVYENVKVLSDNKDINDLIDPEKYEDNLVDDCIELYFCYLLVSSLYPDQYSFKEFLTNSIINNETNSLDGFYFKQEFSLLN